MRAEHHVDSPINSFDSLHGAHPDRGNRRSPLEPSRSCLQAVRVVRSLLEAPCVRGVEAEHYKSLDGMRVGAEVVVLGTITDVDSSREFGGVSDAEPVRLAALTVNVEEVLSGRLASNEASILLEVTLPGARSISELTSLMPRERAVFFLRNKGTEVSGWGWPPDRIEAERPFYRLASSQGLLREFDNVVRPPEGAEDDFLAALAGRPFGDVVQEVSRP